MRIGLHEIDPVIAKAMEDRLCAPLKEFLREEIHWGGWFAFNWDFHKGSLNFKRKREPNADERAAYDLRKQREERFSQIVAGTVFAPVVLGGIVFGGLQWYMGNEVAIPTAVAAWLTGITFGISSSLRARPKANIEQGVQLEEMRAVFPLLTLSRAERVYCDTLQMLAHTQADAAAEQTMRETLRQLNDLLASSRQLETRRATLLPLMGMNVIKELEREYGALGQKLDQTTDYVARQSFQQSLQMCQARLENARTLQQGLERINAQQEAILHTLASAQSALARMQIVSEPQMALAAEEIAATVAQMNQQTYAVEQAVEEVITLRAQ
jgi:hypothetical protein